MTVSQRSSNNPVEHRKRITSLLLFGEKSGPNVYSKASHLFILDFLDNQKTESTDRGSLKEKKKDKSLFMNFYRNGFQRLMLRWTGEWMRVVFKRQ